MSDDAPVRPFPRRRPQRAEQVRRWRTRLLVVGIPILLLGASALRYWVDLLWFQEVGQRDVLVTRLQWGTAMGIGFGIFTFLVLWLNFRVARHVARDDLYVPFLATGADPDAPEQPVIPHFVLRPILLGVATVGAVVAGLVASSRWEVVLRFLGRTDFGVTDPHFHHDAAFYVFTIPLLELVARSLQVLLVLTGLAVVAAYLATGVIRYTPVPRVARGAVVHLSWLIGAFLVVAAAQYRISMWNLATGARGVVAGAGWTDVHARIPAMWTMLVASLVLAVVVVAYARRERWRIVGGAVVGWFAASVLLTGIVPSLVQTVLVEPNELDRETPVMRGNIANTRTAFDLDSIATSKFDDDASRAGRAPLTADELLRDNRGTTDNLRLWSPTELGKVVNQEQALRRYYTFNSPDVDRYTIDGDYRQVMLSVRELDPNAATVASGWTNERLAFTHGFGAVASLPNEATEEGRPRYLLQDLPPRLTSRAASPLRLDRPEVYFGEAGTDFVVVGSKQREVTATSNEEDAASDTKRGTTYDGHGGIRIGSIFRRIAFASTFGDPRIVFSGQFTDTSRLMFRRTVAERVRTLAPFLDLDGDPYAVIVDGRLQWIQDAYTTSDRFPYSDSVTVERDGHDVHVNYMRNSVKAVVDAYDGDVTLYAVDEQDPILEAWRSIFPKLFVDGDTMPDELRAHVRYPEDLFTVQTGLWTRYHMTDVADFYRREDQWAVPTIGDQELQAYYVLARLPGQQQEELLLIRPMTPFNRKNMVSYMVARSDGEHYGEVQTLRLSTQRLTQGPSQVQALIKQDSDVSRQVLQWTTANNDVIFGDLLVLPVEQSLLYVQPVYLQNKEVEIPEFQRVVVVLGTTVAWGRDFEEAAQRLLAEKAATLSGDGSASGSPDAGSDDGSSGASPDVPAPAAGDFSGLDRAQLAALVAEVSAAYDRADACQRDGDLVCFAEQIERVRTLLDEARARR